MKIQQFAGGAATRLAPQYINQDQGAEYINIDNTTGELAPVKAATPTGVLVEKYNAFFTKDSEWVSSDLPTTFLEFQGVMYATNGQEATKRSDGVTHSLGIAAPTDAPVLTSENLANPLEELDIVSDLNGGDLPANKLSYRLYNKQGDVLSSPLEILVGEMTVVDGEATAVVTSEVIEETVNYYPIDDLEADA